MLVNTSRQSEEDVASAYFAPPGRAFAPLAVPGSYFTAIASDAAGRSAVAGYDALGPAGPGLYLSRRESPDSPFSAPILLSASSSDPRPQLAYDASGRLTVAWSEGGRVAIVVARPGESTGAVQVMSGSAIASDEQLSVGSGGEAVLVWAGAAHTPSQGWMQTASTGLQGTPAPLFASVRAAGSESFGEPAELTSAAVYSQGLYPFEADQAPRELDAMNGGRAMVAWLESTPTGPQVKTALYAEHPGCATPAQPLAAPLLPTITSLRESARTWREGNHVAKSSATKESSTRKIRRPPVGTTFRFALNVPARVTFTFARETGGRRIGKKCSTRTARNEHARRCTRTITAGMMTFSAHTGTNKVQFQGLISRNRRLKPGRYILLATPTASGGRPTTRTLHFTIASR